MYSRGANAIVNAGALSAAAAAAATHGFALRGGVGGNDDPRWSVDWRNKMVPVVNQMPNMT